MEISSADIVTHHTNRSKNGASRQLKALITLNVSEGPDHADTLFCEILYTFSLNFDMETMYCLHTTLGRPYITPVGAEGTSFPTRLAGTPS